jgi:hypothetical protein
MQRNMNGSPSSKQLKIQTRSVRLVSIVERCAAKAYLVVAIPQQLKQATVKMLPKVSITSYFFSPNLGAMWLRLVRSFNGCGHAAHSSLNAPFE